MIFTGDCMNKLGWAERLFSAFKSRLTAAHGWPGSGCHICDPASLRSYCELWLWTTGLDWTPSRPLAYLYPPSTVVRLWEAVFCTSQAKVRTSVITTAALTSCCSSCEVPVWRLGIFKDISDFLWGKKTFFFYQFSMKFAQDEGCLIR